MNLKTVISLPDMFKALSKSRSRNDLLNIHMKFVLLTIIGVLLWQNTDARRFTAQMLSDAAQIVHPEASETTHQFNLRF